MIINEIAPYIIEKIMLALFDGNSTNTQYITTGETTLPTIYTTQVPTPSQPFGCFASYNAYNLTATEVGNLVNFTWNEATQGITYQQESQNTSSATAWQSFEPVQILLDTYAGLTDVDYNYDLQVYQLFFHYTNSYHKLTQLVISQSLIETLGRYNMYWAVCDYKSNTQSNTIDTSSTITHAYAEHTYQGYTSTDYLLGTPIDSVYKTRTFSTSTLANNGVSISYSRALTQIQPSLWGESTFNYFTPLLMATQDYNATTYSEVVLSDQISFYVPPYEVGTYSAGYQDGKEVGERTGWQEGYNDGLEDGKEIGYSNGLQDGQNSTFQGPFSLLGQAFSSTTQILELEVFPHITIGALVFIPVAVTVMVAIVKMIKR